VHAGEEDHARPGWTTSRLGQDSPWKSQSESINLLKAKEPNDQRSRMTEDREKWRKYVHGVSNPRIEDGKEQNYYCYTTTAV